jgi:hypothetical protein
MKKILTGLSNNISLNKHKIKVWSESFKRHSDGEIVLIAANATDEDIQACVDLNIKYYQVTVEDTWYINNKRLKHTKDFLDQSDADLFLITDVFDVLFQSDPFSKMDLDNYDVFISREGILVCEEPWNADVINRVFPDEIQSCMNQEIVCSGIIGGKREALVKLYDKLDYMCENSLNGHNIKDQAALIIMVKNGEIDRLKNFSLDEGWAMHCQSAGPTQFFESWGLKNSLIRKGYGIPELKEDGFVYTQTGIKYNMVHQFNRVDEWKKIITKEYE